jgi:hypothetical protein
MPRVALAKRVHANAVDNLLASTEVFPMTAPAPKGRLGNGQLRRPAAVRLALGACAWTLTGKAAAGSTQRRKRSAFYNALGYAIEGLTGPRAIPCTSGSPSPISERQDFWFRHGLSFSCRLQLLTSTGS